MPVHLSCRNASVILAAVDLHTKYTVDFQPTRPFKPLTLSSNAWLRSWSPEETYIPDKSTVAAGVWESAVISQYISVLLLACCCFAAVIANKVVAADSAGKALSNAGGVIGALLGTDTSE